MTHYGKARFTYPVLSAVVCAAALLAPVLAGRPTHSIEFVAIATVLCAALGYVVGSREDGLRALSAVDGLTQLFNRRHFELNVQREVARALRQKTSLALLVIDVDGLKNINDILGHGAGDRAICAVGDALRHSCRADDLAARWGGDEFVVVAPATNEQAARALAERIIATVQLRTSARRPIGLFDSKTHAPTVTVSIGVASAGPESVGKLRADALFAAADRALYHAKASGPGAVRCASGEGTPSSLTVRGQLRLAASGGVPHPHPSARRG
jgi:diguanylate cyclase (GGDEF)-like protein